MLVRGLVRLNDGLYGTVLFGVFMSSDRELLELAAKAAGVKLRFLLGMYAVPFSDGPIVGEWNPLDSDSDAFRLLVSLNLSVQCPGGMVFTDAYHVQSPDPIHVAVEMVSDDPAKALRRAIVRVAAELGREMKP